MSKITGKQPAETGFLPSHERITAPDANPDSWALVLHGIFGSGRNWAHFARRLVEARPTWGVVVVDLRCHGDSRGAPPPHTVAACAEDLARLVDALKITPHAVIGHSFGGKVALVYGQAHADRALERIWSLDTAPGPLPPEARRDEDHEVFRVIDACRRAPMPIASRAALTAWFTAEGFSPMIGQWMTTNLRPLESGEPGSDQSGDQSSLVWRFDIEGMEALLRDYFVQDLWPYLEAGPTPPLKIRVLRAGKSDRWTPAEVDRLRALPPAVESPVLPDAGHWVHVDDPDGLLALLAADLP